VRRVEIEKWGLPFRERRKREGKAKGSWTEYSRTCLSAFENCNRNLGTGKHQGWVFGFIYIFGERKITGFD